MDLGKKKFTFLHCQRQIVFPSSSTPAPMEGLANNHHYHRFFFSLSTPASAYHHAADFCQTHFTTQQSTLHFKEHKTWILSREGEVIVVTAKLQQFLSQVINTLCTSEHGNMQHTFIPSWKRNIMQLRHKSTYILNWLQLDKHGENWWQFWTVVWPVQHSLLSFFNTKQRVHKG